MEWENLTSTWKAMMRWAAIAGAAAIAAVLLASLPRAGLTFSVYGAAGRWASSRLGLDYYAAEFAAIVATTAFTLALPTLAWFMFFGKKRALGSGILIGAAGLVWLLAATVGQNVYFDRSTGEPLRYYADTPEGRVFSFTPGFDPRFGVKFAPYTPEVARAEARQAAERKAAGEAERRRRDQEAAAARAREVQAREAETARQRELEAERLRAAERQRQAELAARQEMERQRMRAEAERREAERREREEAGQRRREEAERAMREAEERRRREEAFRREEAERRWREEQEARRMAEARRREEAARREREREAEAKRRRNEMLVRTGVEVFREIVRRRP